MNSIVSIYLYHLIVYFSQSNSPTKQQNYIRKSIDVVKVDWNNYYTSFLSVWSWNQTFKKTFNEPLMTSIIDFKLFYVNLETSVSQQLFKLKLFDLFDYHRFIKTHWKSTTKIIQLLANQIAIIRSMMWINVDACSWETNFHHIHTHIHV